MSKPSLDPPEHRWLSEGAETLVAEVLARPDDALHCDVLIVGSGYGGAVAAARLAGARNAAGDALRVWVLERGQEFLPGRFAATFAELPGHVRISSPGAEPRGRAEGVFDLKLGGDVIALVGNGLGGGSLINAAVMERPLSEAFAIAADGEPHWPAGLDLATLAPAYAKAEQMLALETIVETPPKLASLARAGEVLGATESRKAKLAISVATHAGAPAAPTPAGVAMRSCLRCGDCVTGCNHQAKKSLDTNYLALARANGARLFCGGTVRRLATIGTDALAPTGYEVELSFTDPKKARADRESDRPYVLRAGRVILAAGSFGSTEILLRSQAAGLPIATDRLGHRFSTNGDMIAVAHRQRESAPSCGQEDQAPAERRIGPTITGLVRHTVTIPPRPGSNDPPRESSIVIEEFGIPAPLRRLLGEVVATVGTVQGLVRRDDSRHAPDEPFDDPLAITDELIDHSPVYGLMGDDGAAGQLVLEHPRLGPDGQVKVMWTNAGDVPVFGSQLAALRDAHESRSGLGGQVLPNPTWRPWPPFKVIEDLTAQLRLSGPPLTVHPLGGCPMGADRTRGAVDDVGRVYAAGADAAAVLPSLAVLDGSIVPVSLGINPALTIAALAERAVPRLAASWGWTLRERDAIFTAPRPQLRDLTRPAPTPPTRFTLAERMTGMVSLGAWTPEPLQADIRFDIATPAQLMLGQRRVGFREVRLRFGDASSPSTVTCRGEARVLVRESSRALRRSARSLRLAIDRLRRWVAEGGGSNANVPACPKSELWALSTHLGARRQLIYDFTVTDAPAGTPLRAGDRLRLTKRIEFSAKGNPWLQLSEGDLVRLLPGGRQQRLGRLTVDLGFFAEQLAPLLSIESQADEPNALGDVIALGLWVFRSLFGIHALNFLPPFGSTARPNTNDRLPGPLEGVEPDVFTFPVTSPASRPVDREPTVLRFQLAHYEPSKPAPDPARLLRPTLLIHGYGAGGATFAHPAIPNNLVSTLLATGRHVWVLDLRTSIGLEQAVAWTFDQVAENDIPEAIEFIALRDTAEGGSRHEGQSGRVDVIAHCIGAAMTSVALLGADRLQPHIGTVVLSQVGPLLRMSAFNRFRGYVASYLRQFIGAERFDVGVQPPLDATSLLIDGVLATFPYPDDDGEAERLKTVPGFARVRHRADAIFGQTMVLANVGDDMLRRLDAIYGPVMVESLAQTIHYAREKIVTNPAGLNEVVSVDRFADRLAMPVLMVHGRRNALFDWQGSLDTIRLLSQVFRDEPLQRDLEAFDPSDLSQPAVTLGASRRRRLLLLRDYGHQDSLIGHSAHADVFPSIVSFLDEFDESRPKPVEPDEPIRIEFPWMGPMLGRAKRTADRLTLRLVLRAPPARAGVLGVVFVPARKAGGGWRFDPDRAAMRLLDADTLAADALVVELRAALLGSFDGFAALTVHDDLPRLRQGRLAIGVLDVDSPFMPPAGSPPAEVMREVSRHLDGASPASADLSVVEVHPSWVAAVREVSDATPAAADPITLALASCQYPAGLLDRAPAQASLARLADHIASSAAATRPQALLLVGDQVYVDDLAGLFVPSASSAVDRAYQLNFTLPAWRRVTKALPTLPMLDDHEVADDWEPGSQPPDPDFVRSALERYRHLQHALVAPPGTTNPPFDYRLEVAGVPIFMFDDRSTRQRRGLRPSPSTPGADDAKVRASGVDDLTAWLDQQPADRPKIVVSSTTVFPRPRAADDGSSPECLGLDDWSGYPASQRALLAHIREHGIRNVILLSGDRHLSSVSSLWIDSPHGPIEVVSIVSSGLYAPWPFANARADELMLDGPFSIAGEQPPAATLSTAVVATANGFALVRLEPDAGGWRVQVTLDLASGRTVLGRRLGDAHDRRWT